MTTQTMTMGVFQTTGGGVIWIMMEKLLLPIQTIVTWMIQMTMIVMTKMKKLPFRRS
jgi:hypothetical protein